jgi:hypothetical protein
VAGQAGTLLVDQVTLATFAPERVLLPPCPSMRGAEPSSTLAGRTLLADGFEDGRIGEWSSVLERGGATARVVRTAAHRGACGLRVASGRARASDLALLRRLPAGSRTFGADGWFRVGAGDGADSVVPLLRLAVGRQPVGEVDWAGPQGRLSLASPGRGGRRTERALGLTMAAGQWHHVRLTGSISGGSARIHLTMDGQQATTVAVPAPHGVTALALTAGRDQGRSTLDVDDLVLTAG